MRQQSEGVGCGQSTVFPRPRKRLWRLRRIREDASLQRVGGELMPEGGEVWWHVRSRAEERQLCGVCRWQLVAWPRRAGGVGCVQHADEGERPSLRRWRRSSGEREDWDDAGE